MTNCSNIGRTSRSDPLDLEFQTRESREICPTSRRVLAYCHDSVGIGHLRRTMAICEHVGKQHPCASFLLATGTPYLTLFKQIPRVDSIKLPALKKLDDGSYGCKYLTVSSEQMMRCRESLLLQTAEFFNPDVLLVDKAPVGVCGELLPTLRWVRKNRPKMKVVFGMRDIEDDPEATIAQWTRDGVYEVLENCFDEIWVYGVQEVFDPREAYRLSPKICEKLRFMGYIARDACAPARSAKKDDREVLVTVGGGTDGENLLDAYLSGVGDLVSAMGVRSTIVGGPDLPPSAADRLRRKTMRVPGATWIDFEPYMGSRIAGTDMVVSMAGYNTLCEIATHCKPALVVPRIKPRMEQAIRARLWGDLGVVRHMHPSKLSNGELAHRVMSMLKEGKPNTEPLVDLNGLQRVRARFNEFWDRKACDANSLCL